MDDEEDYSFYSKLRINQEKASKRDSMKLSPEKLTFSGNFTQKQKIFNINLPERRASMKKDIMDTVLKRTESKMMSLKSQERDDGDEFVDDNPMYEDPRDVIGQKPAKPPRKRNLQGVAVASPKLSKEGKSLLKEQKRKLTKKYESLITTLMDRCEDNIVMISERDSTIAKLKEKLKTVLEYNKLFAEENDQLKTQYTTLVKYVEECKQVIKDERDRCEVLESKCKELGDKVKQYEVPDRDHSPPITAVPLVEVCMKCSSRQIILNQAREQNSRLQKDMQALKDVLYRLNVQLSRYQEKLRSGSRKVSDDKGDFVHKPSDKYDALDSLITTSLGYKAPEGGNDETYTKSNADDHTQAGRLVDLSGLLSAQALAPLFDAYQENLQEKDSLIIDYEKQFEMMNKKSKQIVEENKALSEKVVILERELMQVRQSQKKLYVEKETVDIEKATLIERAQKAENKLKEVYEMYEDKICKNSPIILVSAMMRDYETVHREYFATRSALEATEGKLAQLDVFRARTVPADLHERRLDHCKSGAPHSISLVRETNASIAVILDFSAFIYWELRLLDPAAIAEVSLQYSRITPKDFR
ncbi:unnamed protein product [Diatraea saccharalis]|uniref:Uncharacterized protein n=1 Tax=Diatraea saccharalis TaxID=40085 RepID=A0A9N9RA84_9NEOP|nr:unnamed protein product [Diatraea saccharalis]